MSDPANAYIVEPNLNEKDQGHAEAIDALRSAKVYLLIIPKPEDENEYSIYAAGTPLWLYGAARNGEMVARDTVIDAIRSAEEEAA